MPGHVVMKNSFYLIVSINENTQCNLSMINITFCQSAGTLTGTRVSDRNSPASNLIEIQIEIHRNNRSMIKQLNT